MVNNRGQVRDGGYIYEMVRLRRRAPGRQTWESKHMAFIPRLPTWHNTITIYKYDPDTELWTLSDDTILGQIYTQLRTQDDSTRGTLYLEYPVDQDFLRDLADYENVGNSDVVTFEFPTVDPRTVGYRVRDVQPRWLGFPNEHIMATLDRLTPDELTLVIDGPPTPPPPPDFKERELLFFSSSGGGALAPWTDSGSGDTFATADVGVDGAMTELLELHPASAFDVPSGATVVGMLVVLGREYNSASSTIVRDELVQLGVDLAFSSDKKIVADWPGPGGPQPITLYGSDSDMWGMVLTPADINGAVKLIFQAVATFPDADVVLSLNYGFMRVFYQP